MELPIASWENNRPLLESARVDFDLEHKTKTNILLEFLEMYKNIVQEGNTYAILETSRGPQIVQPWFSQGNHFHLLV